MTAVQQQPRTRAQKVWMVVGIALASVIALAGLAVVATVVIMCVAMSNYGSNK
jgi:hypothetical protein